MTAAQMLASYRAMIGAIGQDVVVIKVDGSRITVKARVAGYTPREIQGAIVAGDSKVIMMAEALSSVLPLTAGADRVEIASRQCEIKAVDDRTRRIAGTLIALELQVAT